jgi:hypothetical protein
MKESMHNRGCVSPLPKFPTPSHTSTLYSTLTLNSPHSTHHSLPLTLKFHAVSLRGGKKKRVECIFVFVFVFVFIFFFVFVFVCFGRLEGRLKRRVRHLI